MRLDRLTNKFQLALADAQSLALGHDNQFIEPLHLMSALLNQEGGSVSPLLTSAGINAGQLRTDINQALNRLPQVEGTGGDVQLLVVMSSHHRIWCAFLIFATSWRKNVVITLSRQNCSFWRHLSLAARWPTS